MEASWTPASGGVRVACRSLRHKNAAPSGKLYDAEQDRADGKAFLECAEGDRHQFRFIVSAEDGGEYDDIKPLSRRLMARLEEDRGTKPDRVAVDHYNTDHPHTHTVTCRAAAAR